jgi:hypothetical protein
MHDCKLRGTFSVCRAGSGGFAHFWGSRLPRSVESMQELIAASPGTLPHDQGSPITLCIAGWGAFRGAAPRDPVTVRGRASRGFDVVSPQLPSKTAAAGPTIPGPRLMRAITPRTRARRPYVKGGVALLPTGDRTVQPALIKRISARQVTRQQTWTFDRASTLEKGSSPRVN